MKPAILAIAFLCSVTIISSGQVSVAKEKPGMKSDPVPRSDSQTAPAKSSDDDDASDAIHGRSARPRNNEESSSRDSIIDLSPPANDANRPEREDEEASVTGVNEMKPWNPHKAEKSTEVGEYYFKEKNYKAAISRYREALEYKPRDARATFRLAEALEKIGQTEEARQRYEEYLKILKNGPFTGDARIALERIKAKTAKGS